MILLTMSSLRFFSTLYIQNVYNFPGFKSSFPYDGYEDYPIPMETIMVSYSILPTMQNAACSRSVVSFKVSRKDHALSASNRRLERHSSALNVLTDLNGLSHEVVSLLRDGELEYRVSGDSDGDSDSRDLLHRRINDAYHAMLADQERSRESTPESPAF